MSMNNTPLVTRTFLTGFSKDTKVPMKLEPPPGNWVLFETHVIDEVIFAVWIPTNMPLHKFWGVSPETHPAKVEDQYPHASSR